MCVWHVSDQFPIERCSSPLLHHGPRCLVAIGSCVGLLDIFGFEMLQTNTLEQLCINFVNERVQRHFVQHMIEVRGLGCRGSRGRGVCVCGGWGAFGCVAAACAVDSGSAIDTDSPTCVQISFPSLRSALLASRMRCRCTSEKASCVKMLCWDRQTPRAWTCLSTTPTPSSGCWTKHAGWLRLRRGDVEAERRRFLLPSIMWNTAVRSCQLFHLFFSSSSSLVFGHPHSTRTWLPWRACISDSSGAASNRLQRAVPLS